MRKLNFEGPINGLSLGNVSVNFIKELKRERILDHFSVSPSGRKGEFEAYDKLDR